ncbi:MAG TPA: type 2 lanthipeptide synthetase LanM family protein [Ktedonobacterales bacterium]
MPALSLVQPAVLSIIAAASSLDERLGAAFVSESSEESHEVVNARLDTWRQVIARGNWDLFQQRLAWDGLDVEKVRGVLGKVHMREGAALPSWASLLDAVLRLAIAPSGSAKRRNLDHPAHLRCLVPSDPLPFEELITPFLLVAQQRLKEHAGAAYHLLSCEAHTSLERHLLQELTGYAARAFHLEFSLKRFQARSPITRLLSELQDSDDRTLYQDFVEQILGGELIEFFQHYPVLARLLARVTELWVEATAEFLGRLAADWASIEQVLGAADALAQVVKIEAALSDPHRGRRSVLALTFASGHKLVYKPKNLGIEVAYNRLLAWMNEQGISLPFKILTVINRGSYGWVEFVTQLRCQDAEAGRRYYQRAGMLLCLMYVLVGTDCHHNNLVAHGEHPVLVDMEALMQHRAYLESLDDGVQAQLLAQEMIADSVLHTGFLPSWQIDKNGHQAYDISGLRGPDELVFETIASRWEHVNTDRMELKSKPIKVEASTDYTSQNGISLLLAEHGEDVLTGFEHCYRFLLAHRESLLKPGSPLYDLKHQQLRLIYRNTQVYGSLLQCLLAPQYLRDGADRTIQLEALGLAVMPPPEVSSQRRQCSRWWPILAEEQQAMQQMDIPFFSTRADSDSLILLSGQSIEGCFRGPSFDLVISRLQALCAEDLERQLGFISGSLYAYVARDPVGTPVRSDASLYGEPVAADEQVKPERLLAHALQLAETIDRHTIRASDGSASWIVPQYMSWADRYQLQPVGYDLYSGVCGIALFLAAVERVTGGAGYRELALGALQPLRKALHLYGSRLAKELGIGAATGLASVVYTLTAISQLLDEPALLADARQAAELITFESIAKDEALDIFDGSAGALLGLLALYGVAPDQSIRDRAVACGERLLEARMCSRSGYRAWPGFTGKPLTGFSHGAAGITYALLRLYALTHNTCYQEAADEGIAYEDSTFLPEINNWPDLRSEESLEFRVAWCHGAPGIGLARLGGLPSLDTDQVRKDIEIALHRTEQEGVQALDHLCCGNMGRVDILLTAAQQLSDLRLARVAGQAMGQMVRGAEQRGAFALDPLLPRQVQHFGFFQGTAGLGYTLLRVAYPGQLPSVLLWQ